MKPNANGAATLCVCTALLLGLLATSAVPQATPLVFDKFKLANGRTILGKITACTDDHLVIVARKVEQRYAIADVREIDVKTKNATLLDSIVRAALRLGNGVVACDVAASGRLLEPDSALFKAVAVYPKASETRLKLKNVDGIVRESRTNHKESLAPRAKLKRDIKRCNRNIAKYQKTIDNPNYTVTVTKTTRVECTKCDGKGKVERTVVRGEQGEALRTITRRCQKCNGKGTVKKKTKTKVTKTKDVAAAKRKRDRETAKRDSAQVRLKLTEDGIAEAQALVNRATAVREAILKEFNALCLKMWKDPGLQKALAPPG